MRGRVRQTKRIQTKPTESDLTATRRSRTGYKEGWKGWLSPPSHLSLVLKHSSPEAHSCSFLVRHSNEPSPSPAPSPTALDVELVPVLTSAAVELPSGVALEVTVSFVVEVAVVAFLAASVVGGLAVVVTVVEVVVVSVVVDDSVVVVMVVVVVVVVSVVVVDVSVVVVVVSVVVVADGAVRGGGSRVRFRCRGARQTGAPNTKVEHH